MLAEDAEGSPNTISRGFTRQIGWYLRFLKFFFLILVGGFKHGSYFPEYMGCHPSHGLIFF